MIVAVPAPVTGVTPVPLGAPTYSSEALVSVYRSDALPSLHLISNEPTLRLFAPQYVAPSPDVTYTS